MNALSHLTEVDYHGAKVTVEIDDEERVQLRINGLVREQADANPGDSTIRLASTVQTGYEWHEFIEAVVEYLPETIALTLTANRQELASHSWPRTRRA